MGDCRDTTNAGCDICRNFRYNGTCVASCPPGTLVYRSRMECVTPERCRAEQRYTVNDECRYSCPCGTRRTPNYTCVDCPNCSRQCRCSWSSITSLSRMSNFDSCHAYYGDLTIHLPTGAPDTMDLLTRAFSNLKVIDGTLKIFSSPPLTSLSFLRNLRIITGNGVDPGGYALTIKGNDNLKELWTTNGTKLTISNGRVMIAYNSNLCLSKIHDFQNNMLEYRNESTTDIFDETSNGYDQICHSKRIEAHVESITTVGATLIWSAFDVPDTQNVAAYIIHYAEAPQQNITYTLPETCIG